MFIQRFGKLLIFAGLIGCLVYGFQVQTFAAERRFPINRAPQGEDSIRKTHTPGDVVLEETDDAQPQPSYTYLDNPDRDVWVFDTHSASLTKTDEQQFQRIKVRRFMQMYQQEKTHWNDSTLDEFWETFDPEVPLIVFVHGNYTTPTEAIASANMLENKFFPGNGEFAAAKYRLLIWSWPAEMVYQLHLRDAKLKGYYSIKQGEYLARFLALVPEDSRVSLVGYSFGARTTCEAVQRLSFNKQSPKEPHIPPLQIRNLLLSPAIDQYSLAPRFRYGNVLDVSQQSIVLFNPRDFALRFYPALVGPCGPHSLGREGIPGLPAEWKDKITGINISAIAETQHTFVVFFRDPNLNRRLGRYLLFE